ncbi:MAG: diguanylate cyclase domain-containing protein [Gammaproteobacteria bacterium]
MPTFVASAAQRIHGIRLELLDRVWLGILVLALVGAPASASRALSTGWLPLYSVHVALAALVIVLFLARRRLSFMARSVTLLTIFFVVGAAGLFTLGLLGAGLWWLVMASLLASALLSMRVGLMVSGASLFLIALAAAGFTRGALKVPVDPAAYVYDVTSWVSFLMAAALLPIVVFQSIALFQRSTADLIEEIEQQRAREAMAREDARGSAERFTDFAGIAADGFWETDGDLRLTFVSQSFADALGLRASDMLGRTPGEAYLLRYPGAPRLEEFMAPLRRHEAFSHLQFPVQDAQGRRALLACLGRPRFDAAGAFLGYRGVVRDITQQYKDERAIKEAAERLRLITDNAPAHIYRVEHDRRVSFSNRAALDFVGRPAEALVGQPFDRMYPPAAASAIAGHMDRAFAGEDVTFEFEADGRHFRGTLVPDARDAGAIQDIYGLVSDITPLKRIENELRQLALLDPLTGLANRRRFNERLAEAVQRSERTGQRLALMYLDLDGFKRVNDTLGHDVGDELLKEFGRRVVACVRQTDTVCRLAGDEFVVILENLASDQDPERVALKIIAATRPAATLKGHEVPMSTSIGIALREAGGIAGDALLKQADAALYQAKRSRRGSHAVAPSG